MTQVKDLVDAFDAFIVGCKDDGIWDAIKACCILAGWDGLNGCLVPLKGSAPTNNNFVSGDYSRTAGLTGDGSTKYLDSNRANNADPQNSNHNAMWVSSFGSGIVMIGTANEAGGNTMSGAATRNRNNTADITAVSTVGLYGMNRSGSTQYTVRNNGTNRTVTQASQTPSASQIGIFAGTGNKNNSSAQLAFYSIGESLDLALLDTRVTNLITAIGAAIP